MKTTLLLLVLLVSCGKDPVKKSAAPVARAEASELIVETLPIECRYYHSCTEACTLAYIACFNQYGGQDVPSHLATPEQKAGFDRCQQEGNTCYNKEIQIPMSEHEAIWKAMTSG